MSEKTGVKCQRQLSPDAFPANKRTRDGLSSWCRRCHNAATRRSRRAKKRARREAQQQAALEALRQAKKRRAA